MIRVHRTVRLVVLAAGLTLLLAGCAQSIDGSAVAGGTFTTPAPLPTTSTATFPTTTAVPSPTPPTPTTTSVPPPTTTAFDRVPASTKIGDPLKVDFCRGQGTSFLGGLGYTIDYSPVQFSGACAFRMYKAGKLTLDVYEFSNSPSAALSRPGAKTTRVGGYTVRTVPSDPYCTRDIAAAGIVVTIQAVAIATKPNAPILCKSATRATTEMASFFSRGNRGQLTLPPNSVNRLDMCKIASAATVTGFPVLAGARLKTNSFGSECAITTPKVELYIDAAVVDPARLTGKYTTELVGGHTLLASTTNTASYCSYEVRQGATGSGDKQEEIDASMSTLTGKPAANLCGQTKLAFVKFLDTARLK